MTRERYERHMRFFAKDGQEKLARSRVVVIGAGGLGSHVVQQLALLGVGSLTVVDGQDLKETNRNRYVTARHTDPIPGTRKVDIATRLIAEIDPEIEVKAVHDSLVSDEAFKVVIGADVVFGCVDKEGARLILNELCAAYSRPYLDLATELSPPEDPSEYGGRVCTVWHGEGCLVCRGVLDMDAAQIDLSGPEERAARKRLYGIPEELLAETGPSVVSINGVIASLGVTEFMVALTGIRMPNPIVTYKGKGGGVSVNREAPLPDCYYCKVVRGTGEKADVQRYIREGVGKYLV